MFGHIMGILSSQFAIIGGFLMGAGGIINGLFLRLEMKKEKDSNHIIQKSSMLYQKSIASFVGSGIQINIIQIRGSNTLTLIISTKNSIYFFPPPGNTF